MKVTFSNFTLGKKDAFQMSIGWFFRIKFWPLPEIKSFLLTYVDIQSHIPQ